MLLLRLSIMRKAIISKNPFLSKGRPLQQVKIIFLLIVLDDEEMKKTFVYITKDCESVVCCRVTPK